MSQSFRRWKLPLSAAAAAALLGTAGTAFAANYGLANLSISGRIQSMNLKIGKVRLDGRTLWASPNTISALSQIKGHARVDLKLNRDDHIIGVLKADDQGTSQTGTIASISSTSITIGSNTYNMSSNAQIRYHEYVLSASQVPANTVATVQVDNAGNVDAVWLHQDANLPDHPVLKGQIAAVTSNSVTIDGYTLPVSSKVVVKSNDQTVGFSTVKANTKAIVHINRSGAVDLIELAGQGTANGSITADTSTSLTIGGNTYTYAPNVKIRYRDYTLTPTQVPTGSQAVVRLNASGQAAEVVLKTDANLPGHPAVTGSVSAVGTSSITIGSYDLTLAPKADVTYQGTTSLSNSVSTGDSAAAHLNASGQVDQLVVGASGTQLGPIHLNIKAHGDFLGH